LAFILAPRSSIASELRINRAADELQFALHWSTQGNRITLGGVHSGSKRRPYRKDPLMRCVLTGFSLAVVFFSPRMSFAEAYVASILDSGSSMRVTAWGVAGGAQVGQFWVDSFVGPTEAVLWPETSATPISLNPDGFSETAAWNIFGSAQVGDGRGPGTNGENHALLWHGARESVVDLHPVGFQSSTANGVSDNSQGGAGYPAGDSRSHALLWHGTAESVIDLHPSGFQETYIWDVSGTSQVGWGLGPVAGQPGAYHALLWNGSSSSVVDLHPSGFEFTVANGVSGATQVGSGFGSATSGNSHALLWHGAATSFVDLNPAGLTDSSAEAAAENWQVGNGDGPATGGQSHALVWSGTADSAVDLHAFLNQTGLSFSFSLATGVDENGNIVGWGDTANRRYAIKWTLIPEPATLTLLFPATLATFTRRRTAVS
jgi:hypothetical protein